VRKPLRDAVDTPSMSEESLGLTLTWRNPTVRVWLSRSAHTAHPLVHVGVVRRIGYCMTGHNWMAISGNMSSLVWAM
jgi:hypothetical protein